MRFKQVCVASIAMSMFLGSQAMAQLGGDGPSPSSNFDVVTNLPGDAIPPQGIFGDATGAVLNQVNVSDVSVDLFFQSTVHFTELNVSDTATTGNLADFFNSEINISGGSLGQGIIGGSISSEAEFTESFVSITGGVLGNNAELLAGSTLVLDAGTVGQDFESAVGSTIDVNGGDFSVTRPFEVNGVLNLNAGTVGRGGTFGPDSVLNMTGGNLSDVRNSVVSANVFGTANISGGIIGTGFDAESGSTVNITGGDFGDDFNSGIPQARFEAKNGSTVNISGGTFDSVFDAESGSTVNISAGATLGSFFGAEDGSNVNVTGGSFGTDFDCEAGCNVDITGGTFATDFSTLGDANVTISGGTFEGFFVNQGTGTVISGGVFDTFRNTDGASVNFVGTEFTVDGVAITDLGSTIITDRDVTLAGVLEDGSSFSFVLETSTDNIDDFTYGSAVGTPNFEAGSGDFFANGSSISVTLVAPLLGDVNRDTMVNFQDISPFITVLSSSSFQAEADCNVDGLVTFADISPFIVILSGG